MKRYSTTVVIGCLATALLTGCSKHQPPPIGPVPPAAVPSTVGEPVSVTADRRSAATNRSGPALPVFTTAHFVGSGRCANCHDLLVDGAGNDISIAGHWRSTMMANAAKDPFWQAKTASESHRNSHIAAMLQQKCAACHMPMALVETEEKGLDDKTPIVFGAGFLDQDNPLHEAAMDGISCSFCHQIAETNLGSPESFSGKYRIDTATPPPRRPIYGPYQEPLTAPMTKAVGYIPAYGPQIDSAVLCATCHTIYTPFLDDDGAVAGSFPEQTPYLEWLHSAFSPKDTSRRNGDETTDDGSFRSCQDCHMPHAGTGVIIARWAPAKTKTRDHFSQHHFVGGNVHLLEIMRDNPATVAATASEAQFDATIARTLHQLQSATARIAIERVERRGDRLAVTVAIDNLAGHKFPTGFPSRRAWIHLTVTDEDGAILFESGRPQADGSIAGNENDLDPARFEPHYTIIDAPDQVQIYETILADTAGRVTYTLLRAAGYEKDNRLLPRGFDKETASRDIAVYGAADRDHDFTGGGDRLIYLVPAGNGRITITAELLYTPLSYAFLQDLLLDDHLPAVRRFRRMVERADLRPIPVAASRVVAE